MRSRVRLWLSQRNRLVPQLESCRSLAVSFVLSYSMRQKKTFHTVAFNRRWNTVVPPAVHRAPTVLLSALTCACVSAARHVRWSCVGIQGVKFTTGVSAVYEARRMVYSSYIHEAKNLVLLIPGLQTSSNTEDVVRRRHRGLVTTRPHFRGRDWA